jgi:hypothetical protein
MSVYPSRTSVGAGYWRTIALVDRILKSLVQGIVALSLGLVACRFVAAAFEEMQKLEVRGKAVYCLKGRRVEILLW